VVEGPVFHHENDDVVDLKQPVARLSRIHVPQTNRAGAGP